MRQALKLHPNSHCDAIERIEVEVARPSANVLMLRYVVTGEIRNLLLPPQTESMRADGLWRRMCFEAFLRTPFESYYELNFAPSTQWAAYFFNSYRSGMQIADDVAATPIEIASAENCFELRVALTLNRPANLSAETHWNLGLAAVIEETTGAFSYWALRHPTGKPDFHHADCFAVRLDAVS